MKGKTLFLWIGAGVAVVAGLALSPISSSNLIAANQASASSPLTCNLSQYKATNGLTTVLAGDLLTVSWNGQGTSQLRARFAIDGGTPKQITNFTRDLIDSFDLSRDGKQIAVSRGTRSSDVVLISGFKK